MKELLHTYLAQRWERKMDWLREKDLVCGGGEKELDRRQYIQVLAEMGGKEPIDGGQKWDKYVRWRQMRESDEGAGCRSSEMQKKVWAGVRERWRERSVDSAGLSIIWMQEKESLSPPLVNDHILSLFSSAPPLLWLCHLYCAAYWSDVMVWSILFTRI